MAVAGAYALCGFVALTMILSAFESMTCGGSQMVKALVLYARDMRVRVPPTVLCSLSSVGQSTRLIHGVSLVRVQQGALPPDPRYFSRGKFFLNTKAQL